MPKEAQQWQSLPPELIELQLGQMDLLLAMYPDEIILDETAQKNLDSLREMVDANTTKHASFSGISMCLRLPIEDDLASGKSLLLDLVFPLALQNAVTVDEPPRAKVRVQQPSWLSKASTSRLMTGMGDNEDLLGMIEHIKQAAAEQLAVVSSIAKPSDATTSLPLVRVWFYFPSISTRSKRDDFIIHAPSYHLTGFLYAGKPGLLCVEGQSQAIDDYMKFIKTESWGDIPAHHKKVSERYRENIEGRIFSEMTETTDLVGERRGQRANRGDMKAMEDWLVERDLGNAFAKVLM